MLHVFAQRLIESVIVVAQRRRAIGLDLPLPALSAGMPGRARAHRAEAA